MNQLAEYFKSQEERKRVQQIEQLRRRGHRFIRVRYVGTTIPATDSEGLCYNIRSHGVKDVEAYEENDINTGQTVWKSRPGARALQFRVTTAGDVEADLWDDPDGWNRAFIRSHPELDVMDDKLKTEIEAERGKKFKAELTEKEVLEREIAEKLKRLDELSEVKDGIDKPTSNVDSTGVPRVAARRQRKRNTPVVQPSPPAAEHGGEGAKPTV